MHHLQVAGFMLPQGVGGIDQPLQTGGADHQPATGNEGGPYLLKDLRQWAPHLQQHAVGTGGQLRQSLRS